MYVIKCKLDFSNLFAFIIPHHRFQANISYIKLGLSEKEKHKLCNCN